MTKPRVASRRMLNERRGDLAKVRDLYRTGVQVVWGDIRAYGLPVRIVEGSQGLWNHYAEAVGSMRPGAGERSKRQQCVEGCRIGVTTVVTDVSHSADEARDDLLVPYSFPVPPRRARQEFRLSTPVQVTDPHRPGAGRRRERRDGRWIKQTPPLCQSKRERIRILSTVGRPDYLVGRMQG
jgi:hypothetical protein